MINLCIYNTKIYIYLATDEKKHRRHISIWNLFALLFFPFHFTLTIYVNRFNRTFRILAKTIDLIVKYIQEIGITFGYTYCCAMCILSVYICDFTEIVYCERANTIEQSENAMNSKHNNNAFAFRHDYIIFVCVCVSVIGILLKQRNRAH